MSLTEPSRKQITQHGAKSSLISNEISTEYHEPEEKAEQPSGTTSPTVNAKNSNKQSSNGTYGLAGATVTMFIIFFFFYAIASLVSFILIVIYEKDQKIQNISNTIYYIGLIVYQIAVIVVSIWSYIQLLSLPNSHTDKEYYQLIFYVKFLFCAVYNIYTGVLLCCGLSKNQDKAGSLQNGNIESLNRHIWILLTISHFLNVFSIPIPGIVLFKYLNTKKVIVSKSKPTMDKTASFHRNDFEKTRTISASTTHSYSSAGLNVRKNVFNDKYMLTGICCAYFAHLLVYILEPAAAKWQFDTIIFVTYYQGIGLFNIHYTINQVFLRSFQGMCLNGLFTVFFLSVIAKDYEPNPKEKQNMSDWKRVKLLLSGNRKYWLFVFNLILVVVLFNGFDQFSSQNVLTNGYGYFWISINGMGIFVSMFYTGMFRGIIHKYTRRKRSRFQVNKHQNNTGYVLRACLLCMLFIIQMACIIGRDGIDTVDWIRLLITAMFAAIQMVTLIQLRQVQSNDAYREWLNKHRCINRKCNMKWVYFRFLILLNVINVIYVYVFGIKYYNEDQLESYKFIRISYAMSFSSAAVFIVSLTQLITSYAEFDCIIHERYNTDYGSVTDTIEISVNSKHKIKEKSHV